MHSVNSLEDLGLTRNESHLYGVLCDYEEVLASELGKKAGFGRVYTYDLLDKLAAKGLVSYVLKNNRKFYRVTSPEKLLDRLQQERSSLESRELFVKQMINSFAKKSLLAKKTKVEVYDGFEGIRGLYKHLLRTARSYQVMGGSGTVFRVMPEFEAVRVRKKIKVQRLVGHLPLQELPTRRYAETRVLAAEQFSPSPTILYGDRIVIHIWSDPLAIVIESKELAAQYRSYFALLWKVAKSQ